MRLLRIAIVVGSLAGGCDDGLLVELDGGTDVGRTDSGSAVDDAGERDAGEVDGGEASPPPFDVPECPQFGDAIHICEGDEDLCEPSGDLGKANFDVLATWSRVVGDLFVLQVLFRGAPGASSGEVMIVFDEAGVDGPQDTAIFANDGAAVEGEVLVEMRTWFVQTPDGRVWHYFPPLGPLVRTEVIEGEDNSFVAGELAFSADGRLMQLALPLSLVSADGTAPSYAVAVNYCTDVLNGDEGVTLASPSRGGQADFPVVESAQLCLVRELTCAP